MVADFAPIKGGHAPQPTAPLQIIKNPKMVYYRRNYGGYKRNYNYGGYRRNYSGMVTKKDLYYMKKNLLKQARWPKYEYARMYVKRGEQSNLDKFGPTWKEANQEQKENRRAYGYYGRGMYTPLRKAYNSVKKAWQTVAPAARMAGRFAYDYAPEIMAVVAPEYVAPVIAGKRAIDTIINEPDRNMRTRLLGRYARNMLAEQLAPSHNNALTRPMYEQR